MSALDTPAVGKRENGPFSWLRQGAERLLLSQYLVLILTAIYFLAVWPIVPEISALDTLLDIITAMMSLLVVAVGHTFVQIFAGVDLAAPSFVAIPGCVGAVGLSGVRAYFS